MEPYLETNEQMPWVMIEMFIFVLLGKNIGRQTATRIHE